MDNLTALGDTEQTHTHLDIHGTFHPHWTRNINTPISLQFCGRVRFHAAPVVFLALFLVFPSNFLNTLPVVVCKHMVE